MSFRKRLAAALLCMVMAVSLLPAASLADETPTVPETQSEQSTSAPEQFSAEQTDEETSAQSQTTAETASTDESETGTETVSTDESETPVFDGPSAETSESATELPTEQTEEEPEPAALDGQDVTPPTLRTGVLTQQGGEYTYELDTDGVDAGNYIVAGVLNNAYYALTDANGTINRTALTVDATAGTATAPADLASTLWTFTPVGDNYAIRSGNDRYLTLNISGGGSSTVTSTASLGTGEAYAVVSEYNNAAGGQYHIRSTQTATRFGWTYYNFLRYYSGGFDPENQTTATPTSTQYRLRLFKQIGGVTYTVDAAYLTELLNWVDAEIAAGRLVAGNFSNWTAENIDTRIAAARAALAVVEESYTDHTQATADQTAVNSAAQELHDALTRLTALETYTVTVNCVDDATDILIGASPYIYTYPAGTRTLTPPAIRGYEAPEAQQITVEGDMPVSFRYTAMTPYTVRYDWGDEAPEGLTKPADQTVYMGEQYTVDPTVYEAVGRAVFSGWTPSGVITITGDVTITGSWNETGVFAGTTLTLEYWITNGRVTTESGGTIKSLTLDSTDPALTGAEGAAVTALAPNRGYKEDASRELQFWRCRLLDTTLTNTSTSGTEQQIAGEGDDDTYNGVGFTRIRYYNSRWQVFTEDGVWQSVRADAGGTVTDQLVAYYMEILPVSDEVQVLAADWGKKGDGDESGTDYLPTTAMCSVSVQIIYEDGTANPTGTTAEVLDSRTIVYGYWTNGRGIGTIVFNESNAGYEIYRVTAETGEMTASTNGAWYPVTVNSFTWDGNAKTVWEGAASSSALLHNNANTPSTTDPYDNLMWDENYEAILLRVYVRSISNDESLHVYYREGTPASYLSIYDYSINVSAANTPNTFADFAASADGSGFLTLTNNTVKNALGVTQTVQGDLSQLAQVGEKYKSGLYKLTEVVKADDNRTIYLYYTPQATDLTFVVDYGLPLVVPQSALTTQTAAPYRFGLGTAVPVQAANDVKSARGNYGVFDVGRDENDSTFVMTYTPDMPINGADIQSFWVIEAVMAQPLKFNISIIPATTVYYEDSFCTFSAGWTKVTDDVSQTSVSQAVDKVGAAGANVYGYDPAYQNARLYSMGSAMRADVNASTAVNPTASFTFTGTAADIISLTNSSSGAVLVNVTGEGTNMNYLVDNYYGYSYSAADGWQVDHNSTDCIYQVPVIKIADLDYGTYTVTVTVAYGDVFDHTNAEGYSFWLDAVRVYDSAPVQIDASDIYSQAYRADDEDAPTIAEIRELLLGDVTFLKLGNDVDGAVFIDGAGEVGDIALYRNYGPKNEVYLAPGQGVAFQIDCTEENTAALQLGVKLALGQGASLTVNGTQLQTGDAAYPTTIRTSTDMYYDIRSAAFVPGATNGDSTMVVLMNTSANGSVIALTNMKFVAVPPSDEILRIRSTPALLSYVSSVLTSRTAFAPDVSAVWSVQRSAAVLTVKTSQDVAWVTVDGYKISDYTTKQEIINGGSVSRRLWTYTLGATRSGDHTVIAYDENGNPSQTVSAALTMSEPVKNTVPKLMAKRIG